MGKGAELVRFPRETEAHGEGPCIYHRKFECHPLENGKYWRFSNRRTIARGQMCATESGSHQLCRDLFGVRTDARQNKAMWRPL